MTNNEKKKGNSREGATSYLNTHQFKEQFDAHDALEDVRALRKILFESSLSLSRKYIVENSIVSHAVENMLHLDCRHELLLTFSKKIVQRNRHRTN